jgi:hypothetical protein
VIDQNIFEIGRNKVADASRDPRQDIHDLHACPAARGNVEGVIERGVIGSAGIDVDENTGKADRHVPP